MVNLIDDSLQNWRNDFKEYIDSLDLPRDDYRGIMDYIDDVPSAESKLEQKILAAGYTGKEIRIHIHGRLFAVRELAQ